MTYEYNCWLDENANEEERQKYDILATLPFYDASGGPCYTPLPLKYKIPNKELFTHVEWHMAEYNAIEKKHGEPGIQYAAKQFVIQELMLVASEKGVDPKVKLQAISLVMELSGLGPAKKPRKARTKPQN